VHREIRIILLTHFLITSSFSSLPSETREKVNSIMANTTATLALCALSMTDYAAAADFSRCHLKLFGNEFNKQESQPGSSSGTASATDPNQMTSVKKKSKDAAAKASIVAMWVIRGRAMIGLGCPYLASLHFSQVKSLRSSFPKIEIILASLQDAQVLTAQHTSSIGLMSLQVPLSPLCLLALYCLPFPCPDSLVLKDLIEYEVRRLFISPSNSSSRHKSQKQRKHLLSSDAILQDISRCLLSPLSISLSLHSQICTPCTSSMDQYQDKLTAQSSRGCTSHLCPTPDLHRKSLIPSTAPEAFPSLHMSEDSLSSRSSSSSAARGAASENSTSHKTLRKTATGTRAAFPQHLFPLISAEIQTRHTSSPPARAMRSLVCSLDSQSIPTIIAAVPVIPLHQETLCSYLLFIRRAFYSAQVPSTPHPALAHFVLPPCEFPPFLFPP
jgi:hypothetical protein